MGRLIFFAVAKTNLMVKLDSTQDWVLQTQQSFKKNWTIRNNESGIFQVPKFLPRFLWESHWSLAERVKLVKNVQHAKTVALLTQLVFGKTVL